MSDQCAGCQEYRQVARQADEYAQQAAKQLAAANAARQAAEQERDRYRPNLEDDRGPCKWCGLTVTRWELAGLPEQMHDGCLFLYQRDAARAQLAASSQQLAALRETLGRLADAYDETGWRNGSATGEEINQAFADARALLAPGQPAMPDPRDQQLAALREGLEQTQAALLTYRFPAGSSHEECDSQASAAINKADALLAPPAANQQQPGDVAQMPHPFVPCCSGDHQDDYQVCEYVLTDGARCVAYRDDPIHDQQPGDAALRREGE